MRRVIVIYLLLVFTSLSTASAAVLEVGASYTYATPQEAYHAANSGDTILIHAGTYLATFGDYALMIDDYDPIDPNIVAPDRSNITVQAAGDGRVTFEGVVAVFGTSTGGIDNIVIDGLYIEPLGTNRTGVYIRSDVGDALGSVQVKNCVIYGGLSQGIYIYGGGTHGQHTIEHNTVYGDGTGFGIRDQKEGGWTSNTPIIKNNNVSSCDTGVLSWYGGYTVDYTNSFGNASTNWSSPSLMGTGSVEAYPGFYSTEPSDPFFLYLSDCTDSDVATGGEGGTYMGALPVQTGPCEELLLEVGEGYLFPSIQAAWDYSDSGDTIIVHAGTYPPVSGEYVFFNRGVSDPKDRDNMTIHSAGDGKVILEGIVGIFGTETGMGSLTFEGFYIHIPDSIVNKTGVYIRADGGYSLGKATVRDCVIYGNLNQGIYTYGGGIHAEHLIEHNTVYCYGHTGYGIREWEARGIGDPPPVIRSNMAANFNIGMQSWHGGSVDGFKFHNCNSYGNIYKNYWHSVQFAPTSYSMYPEFVSVDPDDPLFLMFGPDSPDALKTGAHDGEFIGARPDKLGLDPNDCGYWGYNDADLDHDCYVGFGDFAIFAAGWKGCLEPNCD